MLFWKGWRQEEHFCIYFFLPKLAGGKPTRHTYLLWSTPRGLRGTVTLRDSGRYFMQRVKFCSCFYSGHKSRMRSCFPEPKLMHSFLAAFLQRICSEQKSRDLRRHSRDSDAELLSYITKDCTLKSHSLLWEISVLYQASVFQWLFISILKAFF